MKKKFIMIIPDKISHKIMLGVAILAQLAGYYLLALSFHYMGIKIYNPPNQVPTNQHVIASGLVYLFTICSFVISGAFGLILKIFDYTFCANDTTIKSIRYTFTR